jgi:hypothetical protein
VGLDIEQKLADFGETLHELYSQLETDIHSFYKNITKQKIELKRTFEIGAGDSTGKQGYLFGVGHKMPASLEMHRVEETEASRKENHKILKTLIEFYTANDNKNCVARIGRFQQQVK